MKYIKFIVIRAIAYEFVDQSEITNDILLVEVPEDGDLNDKYNK